MYTGESGVILGLIITLTIDRLGTYNVYVVGGYCQVELGLVGGKVCCPIVGTSNSTTNFDIWIKLGIVSSNWLLEVVKVIVQVSKLELNLKNMRGQSDISFFFEVIT